MNIVIVTAGDYPYGMAAETLVRNLVLGIHENGDSVEVVRLRGRRFDFDNDTPVMSSNFLFSKPIKNEALKFFELAAIIAWIPLFVANRKLYRKDNAIVLYGIDYAYQIVPFILWSSLFKMKCYRIVTDHYKRSTIMPVWWKAPKLFFNSLQYRYIDRYLNGVIVLTHYLYDRCVKAGVGANKILLIPHFIKTSSEQIQPVNEGKDLVGFCGHPSLGNGIIDLFTAFGIVRKEYEDLSLLVMGELPESVSQLCKQNPLLTQGVVFTGFVSTSEVAKNLSNCKILVNPRQKGLSAEAGFPTKLGEYFAAKKPVVATRIGDLKTYFTDREQLVFAEPNDPQSLANAIAYLILNPIDAERIANNGYNWALNNLDYKNNAAKLLSFIDKT